jgi:hypothetical protein
MFSYFVKRTNDFISGTINYRGNQLTLMRGWQTTKLSPALEGDRVRCHILVNIKPPGPLHSMTMDIRWSTFYNCVLDLLSSIIVFDWLSKINKWISGWVHSMYSRVYRNWLSTFFVIFYINLHGNSAFFIGLQECDILLCHHSTRNRKR